MNSSTKQRWQVAFFAGELLLLIAWAFSLGTIYEQSNWQYVASSSFLAAGVVFDLIRRRARRQ